ncbi:Putative periplasmic protein [hydrothermal vent metagenome]|uniref:Periplasmic protein n=1 Tax=hydrothermal vent metagenome TaxID=652676 RepID=A0A3B1E4H4_9ZZZZ
MINGITFDDISYKNISISKLDIQYDKSIVFKINNLNIYSSKTKSTVKIDSLLHLSYDGIEIKNLSISDQKLNLNGHVVFNLDDLIEQKTFKLVVKDIEFVFQPKLAPLKAKTLYIKYKDDNIILDFDKPTYNSIKLDKSFAVISNITSRKPAILDIKLQSTSLLQKDLLDILKFYNINLPLYQTYGNNKIITNITVPLNGNNKVKVFVDVKSIKSKIKINDIAVQIDELYVKVDKDIVQVDINIRQKEQNITINNTTNLYTNEYYGKVKIDKFQYKNLFEIKDEQFTYKIDTNKSTLVGYIDKYKLKYILNDNKHIIQIDKPKRLFDFIKIVDINSSKKTAVIIKSSDNFENIYISSNHLNIKFNELDYNKSSNQSYILPRITFYFLNGLINIKDYYVKYDTLNLQLNQYNINTILSYKKSSIYLRVDIRNKVLILKGSALSDKFINFTLQNKIFTDGFINIDMNGTFDSIDGKIELNHTVVKDAKILNNLIALVETTPALINPILALPTLFRLSGDKFDLNGYYIKYGLINFEYNTSGETFKIINSYTKSQIMDLKANGKIDVNKSNINMSVDVIFMKDYSKFFNSIPLVGYLVTGKDKNFMTQIDVSGSLSNPSFETHTVKNISHGSMNLLKRTLRLPFKLIEDALGIMLNKDKQ